MYDILRIVIFLVSFLASAYALYGIDFRKFYRKGNDRQIQVLYLLLSMGLGFVVANFILGLSFAYFM